MAAGAWVRLGGRAPVEVSFRDEVAAALATLGEGTGQLVFTVREVYAEMLAAGTRYAESTVFRTMQRMEAPPARPPYLRLERSDTDGFRVALQGGVRRSLLARPTRGRRDVAGDGSFEVPDCDPTVPKMRRKGTTGGKTQRSV